jgi:diguanylate cyclase (GGDEF)-like protein
MINILEMETGPAIVLTFVAILVTLALSAGCFLLIRRNIRKEKEASQIIVENAVTKKAMEESIKGYIKKIDRFGAFTLFYIDIDGFGDLNEVFGHDACDQLLKEVANRIIRVLPYKASLTRYQNDEFLVFVKDEDNLQRIEKLAQRINEIIDQPYQVTAGESINITASVGVTTYPQAGENFEDLYSNLLLTTYVSKRDGGNKYTNFYASIVEEEKDNMAYFQEVKHAILNKEFVLYYQPIVNLNEKILAGAEALMRWNHPTKGVQAPSTFLKVLEQSGDIKWVGEWGIETMIRMHNTLAEKFPTVTCRLSLNLSTKQLLDANLAIKFIDIMQKNNAKPEHYMLEISDFMVMEKIAVIRTNIYKLRDYGFKIAVDGFELDGQSVQAIQKSPIDVIKLGRSFLKDIENNFMKEKLLQILVKYAVDNNRTLVCEGIETAEVGKYVKAQHVTLGQGYFFAKPLATDAFIEYIDRHQYRVLLDDISALEDNEAFIGNYTFDEEEKEESPEEFLARTMKENSTQSSRVRNTQASEETEEVVYEEVEVPSEEEEAVGLDDDDLV